MKRLFCSILLLFIIQSVAFSQQNSVWYSFGMQGDKTKITELKDFITYQEVREEESPYEPRIDTLDIIERLNDSIYIVFRPNRQGDYALLASSLRADGKIKAMGIYYPSDSRDTVKSSFESKNLPEWKEFTTQWVFSESMVSDLEKSPGYDEVTREAILEALQIRKEISPYITAYMTEFPETKSFRMYRFVELKAQQKFIELGYNPYKQVPYNFEKQFEGDEEVIKALTEPMSFEN